MIFPVCSLANETEESCPESYWEYLEPGDEDYAQTYDPYDQYVEFPENLDPEQVKAGMELERERHKRFSVYTRILGSGYKGEIAADCKWGRQQRALAGSAGMASWRACSPEHLTW